MKLEVLKTDGSKSGRSVELPDEFFNIEPNDHVLWLAVKNYQAAQRQGTHKAKEKSEVSGSTRKLHRQKGTGGSRKGSVKNPLYPGGGRIFGPRPRDYSFKMNQKEKDLARKSALTYKAREKNISVIEDFTLADHKTKNYTQILTNLGLKGKKLLLVVDKADSNLLKATNNLPRHQVLNSKDLNTYQILKANNILFSESSLKHFSN